MTKILKVDCPCCKEKFNYYISEARPFCSERCKAIDLGGWFSETYSIPGEKLRAKNNPLELSEEFDLGDNFINTDEGYEEDEE